MKKFICSILLVAMLAITINIPAGKVYASDASLKVGQTTSLSITNVGDECYVATFKAPSSGYFKVSISPAGGTVVSEDSEPAIVNAIVMYNKIEHGESLYYSTSDAISICSDDEGSDDEDSDDEDSDDEDSDDEDSDDELEEDDEEDGSSNLTSENFMVKKGTTISLVFSIDADEGTEIKVDVTVKKGKLKNGEKECNDSRKKANKIKAKKTYKGICDGYVSNSKMGQDWFAYKSTKAKKWTFTVKGLSSKGTIKAKLVNSKGKKLASATISGKKTVKLKTSKKIQEGKKVYLVITGEDGSYYSLSVK